MSCGECCKQLWVKIMYMILFGALFGGCAVVAWCVYGTTKEMTADILDNHVNYTVTAAMFQTTERYVVSESLGIPLRKVLVTVYGKMA